MSIKHERKKTSDFIFSWKAIANNLNHCYKMIQINISLRMQIVFECETLMLLKTSYCKISTKMNLLLGRKEVMRSVGKARTSQVAAKVQSPNMSFSRQSRHSQIVNKMCIENGQRVVTCTLGVTEPAEVLHPRLQSCTNKQRHLCRQHVQVMRGA